MIMAHTVAGIPRRVCSSLVVRLLHESYEERSRPVISISACFMRSKSSSEREWSKGILLLFRYRVWNELVRISAVLRHPR